MSSERKQATKDCASKSSMVGHAKKANGYTLAQYRRAQMLCLVCYVREPGTGQDSDNSRTRQIPAFPGIVCLE